MKKYTTRLKHHAKRIRSHHYFNKAAIAFMVIFAGLGVYLLFTTHASTPTASIEPENGSLTAPAAVVSDSTASNGKAIQFNAAAPPPPPSSSGSWPNTVADLGTLTSTGSRVNAADYPNRTFSGLSIIDNNGDPTVWDSTYNGYTGSRFYTEGREGPRASGGHIELSNCWIQIHAEATDHADGVQAYGGNGISITSCKILAGGGGATGIFAADSSHGAITLNHVYFGKTPSTINGGYGVRINSDGADSASFNDVVFECGNFDNTVYVGVAITQWNNVRCSNNTKITCQDATGESALIAGKAGSKCKSTGDY